MPSGIEISHQVTQEGGDVCDGHVLEHREGVDEVYGAPQGLLSQVHGGHVLDAQFLEHIEVEVLDAQQAIEPGSHFGVWGEGGEHISHDVRYRAADGGG